MGRPTLYTDELADLICEKIATTSKSMATICKEVGIGYRTHLDWLRDNETYSHNYARAKQDQADLLAEEIIEFSDDKAHDYVEGEFGKVGNATAVQRSRLQVDSRKWIASKLKPKKYGDKVEVENTGEVKIITARFGSPIVSTPHQSGEDT